MSDPLNVLFVPITKIDEEQRLVYGTVAAEELDNSGEMFDYAESKPYFEKWSQNAHTTSGGKSHGNLRVMHTSKVAGRIDQALGFDDVNKTISAVAKVVDDDEWKKVESGCYTGFSMGGRYVKRMTKGDTKRYVADPVEISLVDKPCIRSAVFEVVKADGIVETRHFSDGVLMKEDWDESKHPRDEKGQFASGGGQSAEDSAAGRAHDQTLMNRSADARGTAFAIRGASDANMGGGRTEKRDYTYTDSAEPAQAGRDMQAGRKPATADNWNSNNLPSGRSPKQEVDSEAAAFKRRMNTDSGLDAGGRSLSDMMHYHAGSHDYQSTSSAHAANASAARGNYHMARRYAEEAVWHTATSDLFSKRAAYYSKMGKTELNQELEKIDGDEAMSEYQPKNDEIAAKATELAKAAGRPEGDWSSFIDPARADLIKAHSEQHSPGKGESRKGPETFHAGTDDTDSKPGQKKGPKDSPVKLRDDRVPGTIEDHDVNDKRVEIDERAKTEDNAQKADEPDVSQVWQTADGKTFAKKADAVAHDGSLKKGDAPTLASVIADTQALLNQAEKTDTAPESAVKLNSYADFFEKAIALDEAEPLRKGMFEVSRLASALRECASVQIQCASEATREGDGSAVPATLLDGVKKMGEALIAMAAEEVNELTARLASGNTGADIAGYCYPDSYMSLAVSTLGLEKADLEQSAAELLQKRTPARASIIDDEFVSKSEVDELRAQLAKANGEIAEAVPLIKSMQDQMRDLLQSPRPRKDLGPGARAVEKSDDAGGDDDVATVVSGDVLAKFTPDQLADAAFHLAFKHGKRFGV